MKHIWWESYRPTILEDFVGQPHLSSEFNEILYGNAPMQNYLFFILVVLVQVKRHWLTS